VEVPVFGVEFAGCLVGVLFGGWGDPVVAVWVSVYFPFVVVEEEVVVCQRSSKTRPVMLFEK
jgi:hypothetical protein